MAIINTIPNGQRSYVLVVFNDIVPSGTPLAWSSSHLPFSQTVNVTFEDYPFGRRDVQTSPILEEQARLYANAVNSIWNPPGQPRYSISQVENKVYITVKEPCVTFTEEIIQGSSISLYFNHEDCSIPPLDLISDVIGEGAIPCQDVKLSITTSNTLVNVSQPVQITGNNKNPLNFEVPRGQTVLVEGEDEYGQTFSQSFTTPPVLDITKITISKENEFEQSLITVNTVIEGLELQYSLDGIEWQTSNEFYVALGGSYTMHIKDQYGCEVTKDFETDTFIPAIPTTVKRRQCNSLHELNKGKYLNLCGQQRTMKIGFVCNANPNNVKIFKHLQMILNTSYSVKNVSVTTSNKQERNIPGDHMVYRIREGMHSVPLKNPRDWDDLRGSWAYIEIEIDSIQNQKVDLFSAITYLRQSII
jgi:hypothetical protein